MKWWRMLLPCELWSRQLHLVHRDLRLLENIILWKSQSEPFLADLELVERENQKVCVSVCVCSVRSDCVCKDHSYIGTHPHYLFAQPLGSCSTCCISLSPLLNLMLSSNIMAETTLVHAGPLWGVFQGLGGQHTLSRGRVHLYLRSSLARADDASVPLLSTSGGRSTNGRMERFEPVTMHPMHND